jgi:hypothetical protein
MTIFVPLTAIVLVLLAVSIHLGMLHSLKALMPRWHFLNRNRVGVLILAAIMVHLLEIGLFAIGLGILVPSGAHGQLVGAYEPGFTNDFYYSAITYTALGFGDITPTGPLRLFTAIEAITGLVLIAWTASSIFVAMRQYWAEDRPS